MDTQVAAGTAGLLKGDDLYCAEPSESQAQGNICDDGAILKYLYLVHHVVLHQF